MCLNFIWHLANTRGRVPRSIQEKCSVEYSGYSGGVFRVFRRSIQAEYSGYSGGVFRVFSRGIQGIHSRATKPLDHAPGNCGTETCNLQNKVLHAN